MSMQYLSDAVSGLHDKVDNLEDRTRGCNENEDEEDVDNYALKNIRQLGWPDKKKELEELWRKSDEQFDAL